MKKKYFVVWILTLSMLFAVAGCGGAGTENFSADTAATEAAIPQEAASFAGESYDTAEGVAEDAGGAITSENGIEPVAENGRKLIKTVNLEMQTKEFDTVVEGINKKVQEMGGYIENSSVWGSSYYNTGSTRNSEYTVRIPSDRLDEFIEVVGSLGNVTYKNESVEDVTLQYVDVESRKKALETEQARLLELLEKADNLEDLLTIESRLSEVRYELENYGSQKRLLDNQIDYSTVHITVNEVERITEVKERTFFEEIGYRFNDSLYIVGAGLKGFVIGIIGSLPIIAVWIAVIAGIVLILRKVFYGKKKEKKGPRADEEPKA